MDILTELDNEEFIAVDTEFYDSVYGQPEKLPLPKILGFSVATSKYETYIPVGHISNSHLNVDPKFIQEIIDILNTKTLIFHNAMADLPVLESIGLDIGVQFWDTMLMAHMIQENTASKKLDYLAKMHGLSGKNMPPETQQIIDAFGWALLPPEMLSEYGANDARITYDLFKKLHKLFYTQSFSENLWTTEQEFIRAMTRIKSNGIGLDIEFSQAKYEHCLEQCKEIQQRLGFNPLSSVDLEIAFTNLGLPILKRTPKGNPSFDKKTLEQYDELLDKLGENSFLAKDIRAYRGYQITASLSYKNYLETVTDDGRIHPGFKIHGTKTGRMSCEKPNLQQIPKTDDDSTSRPWNWDLKKAFIPLPGFTLYEFDYHQLEFRLAAVYSTEPKLIEAFNDPDRDVFTEMARELGFTRHTVKTLTYALLYGAGVSRIAFVLGVSLSAAASIRNRWMKTYPHFAAAIDKAKEAAISKGYVRYWTSRRRHFSNPNAESHKAFNSVIQGGGMEIVKDRTVALYREGFIDSPECRGVLQVHDSIVFEILTSKASIIAPRIKEIMEDVPSIFNSVKFLVDYKVWGS